MSATNVIAEIAIGGFYRALPEHKTIFREPRNSHLSITVSSVAANVRIQRRFVIWAMVRIMNAMVVENKFYAVTASLYDGGTNVGTIIFEDPTDFPPGISSNGTTNTTQSTDSLESIAPFSASSWTFEFHDDVLVMEDVFMGAIGTLSAAAQDRSTVSSEVFVGTFLPYRAFYVWRQCGALRMTYSLIIGLTLAAATHAFDNNDFRELRVSAREGREILAEGGYSKTLEMGIGSSCGVATS